MNIININEDQQEETVAARAGLQLHSFERRRNQHGGKRNARRAAAVFFIVIGVGIACGLLSKYQQRVVSYNQSATGPVEEICQVMMVVQHHFQRRENQRIVQRTLPLLVHQQAAQQQVVQHHLHPCILQQLLRRIIPLSSQRIHRPVPRHLLQQPGNQLKLHPTFPLPVTQQAFRQQDIRQHLHRCILQRPSHHFIPHSSQLLHRA